MKLAEPTFRIFPIGFVKRSDADIWIELKEKYIPGLQALEHFSHVHIIWWMHKSNTEANRTSVQNLQFMSPYGEGTPTMGVFATRVKVRPNPIAISIAKLQSVNHENGVVKLQNLDAIDNSPVLDLKPYESFRDRVKVPFLPKFMDFYESAIWFPDDGIGLENND